ncbi:MAG: CDP-alcohol phosphatidyltransferase family protein [Oscillochloridaceae bacterium umkhey_bin13]
MRHVPKALSLARLILAVVLWLPALLGLQRLLALGILVALLTDWLDGLAARHLGVGDEAFSRFDSLADKVLALSVLAWLLLLHPAILFHHPLLALAVLLLGLGSWLTGLIRQGRVTGLHLPSAKLAGLSQAGFVLHTFWQGAYSPLLLYLAGGLWCLAALHEIRVQW